MAFRLSDGDWINLCTIFRVPLTQSGIFISSSWPIFCGTRGGSSSPYRVSQTGFPVGARWRISWGLQHFRKPKSSELRWVLGPVVVELAVFVVFCNLADFSLKSSVDFLNSFSDDFVVCIVCVVVIIVSVGICTSDGLTFD